MLSRVIPISPCARWKNWPHWIPQPLHPWAVAWDGDGWLKTVFALRGRR